MTRKIIQIATDPPDGLCALCDDGTVWAIQDAGTRWRQMAPIPQPEDETSEVEPASTRAPWHPWKYSSDCMWCMDATDESVTEVPGPEEFVRWCGVAEKCGWTMVRAYDERGALWVWRQRDIASETNTETLNVDGKTYAYIQSAIPF